MRFIMTNPNVKIQSSNQAQSSKVYDLTKRTAAFGEAVILFVSMLSRNEVNRPLISQFVRSATSIGANYVEADGAESKKDFRHKIAISKKEAKETMHWCQMLAAANPDQKRALRRLWQEAKELALIFSAIINKAKPK